MLPRPTRELTHCRAVDGSQPSIGYPSRTRIFGLRYLRPQHSRSPACATVVLVRHAQVPDGARANGGMGPRVAWADPGALRPFAPFGPAGDGRRSYAAGRPSRGRVGQRHPGYVLATPTAFLRRGLVAREPPEPRRNLISPKFFSGIAMAKYQTMPRGRMIKLVMSV